MRIFISTGGFKGSACMDTAEILVSHGLTCVELSGGDHDVFFEEKLRALSPRAEIQLHNYSPPPKIPFVMNLGSTDPEILEMSRSLALRALDLSASIGSRTYSVHAPFLVDIEVAELGSRIGGTPAAGSRARVVQIFLESMGLLHSKAQPFQIRILVENNVLTQQNFEEGILSPLFAADPEEILYLLDALNGDAGLLLDLGHLNVSCVTLGLSVEAATRALLPFAEMLHVSDNDGLSDSGSPVIPSSWFLPFLSGVNCDLVLEINDVSVGQALQQVDFVKELIGVGKDLHG